MAQSMPIRDNPRRRRYLISLAAITAMALAIVPLWAEVVINGDAGFEPAGENLNWDRIALGLHLITDLLTGLAYVAISLTLIVLARRAGRNIPFLWAFVAFGIFIIACGMTHFMAVLTLWEPVYWFAGGVKGVTAVASVGTALAVPPLVPKVLAIIDAAKVSEQRRQQVEASNDELSAALAEMQAIRETLQRELTSQQHDLGELAREVSIRRREAESAIHMREEFLSIAAHELKTPLTSVKAAAQLMGRALDQPDPDPERLARLRTMQLSQIERLESLVSDLLDAARIQQGKLELHPEHFPIDELMQAVVERGEHDPHRTPEHVLQIDLPELFEVRWDRERVDQILTNLISNALKYSPGGGRVLVGAHADGERVRLWVRDEGIGISTADLAHLFEPFSRTDDSRAIVEGTGLGLYITWRIVEQHQGAITVTSKVGEGSTFTVTLPLRVQEEAS